MIALRDYQRRALAQVRDHITAGATAACLVAPTGSGKTICGVSWLIGYAGIGGVPLLHRDRGLWIVHRIELLRDAVEQLSAFLDPLDVGVIAPGYDPRPHARVQVATVQTLLARGDRPPAERVVLDEAHHYAADDWSSLAAAYPTALTLGLTATPERQDGRPLGDIFQRLVVAAHYSELVEAGHLVSCRAYVPPEEIEGGIALHPVEAYRRHAEGSRAFLFVSRIQAAIDLAAEFAAAGIPAAAITQRTHRRERIDTLAAFGAGDIRVLTSVAALTEGVNVPAARTAILARGFRHVGNYLQAAGRILRPAPGKPDAILIDLVGATFRHGLPTEDRVYGLDGRPIQRSGPALRQCPACGFVMRGSPDRCGQCQFVFPVQPSRAEQRIYSLELREVFAGDATPETAKRREYDRLLALMRDRQYDLAFVSQEYRKLFREIPPYFADLPPAALRWQFDRFRERAREHGYKPGYAAARFKETFGIWPPREWPREQAPAAPAEEATA